MFSVPFDLASSAQAMGEGKNRWYMSRFLREMRQKVQSKAVQFPKLIDDHGYEAIQTFWDFDNRYTAPMHGFDSARDYYTKCSAIDFLKGIHVPTLAVNARDDSFLGLSCFPESEANVHPFLTLEIPAHGGHVGFWDRSIDGKIWSERRAVEFLTQAIRIHSHESGARRLHRE